MTEKKTKEDILNEKSLIYYMGSGEDEVQGSKQDVLDAMDEYANHMAIEFLNWCVDGTYNNLRGDVDGIVHLRQSTEQLYTLFIQEKNKNE